MSKSNLSTAHLAIDLGASSGRAVLGVLHENSRKLEVVELHRFEHVGLPTPAGPVWDLTGIWRNILIGLEKAGSHCQSEKVEFTSVGVDAWGVDWALLGSSGELLSLPHCYRDPQNNQACEETLSKIGGFGKLYKRTGIQKMAINTIFQVAARYHSEPALFDAAKHLVFLPDLFHFWLSGTVTVEKSIASTSSMLHINTGDWDRELLQEIGLPTHLLGPIIESGATVGTVLPEIAEQTKVPLGVTVIAPGSHDTASAIAAVPADENSNWAYLSSGTWSLLGAELSAPIVTPEAEAVPFTNELGVAGTVRFLKNITGLWMVQELRRELNQIEENEYSFEQLMQAAKLASPFRTIVDPNADCFLEPGNMAAKLRNFAAATEQPEPETVGDLVRCCLESLALCYRDTLESLESILNKSFDCLHIVGGGSMNKLLNKLTANTINRTVICGPTEATAIGNVLVQAMGCGKVSDLVELRAVVRNSFDPNSVFPENPNESTDAFVRFKAVKNMAH